MPTIRQELIKKSKELEDAIKQAGLDLQDAKAEYERQSTLLHDLEDAQASIAALLKFSAI